MALLDRVAILEAPLGSPLRPTWRGRLHLWGLVGAIPAFVILVALADGARARVGVAVYAVALCSMLAVSVTYHRYVHGARSRARWQRADHATIYFAIAGSVTPLCLLALRTTDAVVVLVAIWSTAIAGAVLKFAGWRWRHTRVLGAAMYVGNGWLCVLVLPAVWARFGAVPAVMLVTGGVIYTVGAIAFALRWPTLRTGTFSYHEVWHASTIAAAACHLAAVAIVAT